MGGRRHVVVDPHAFGEQGVGARDVDGHGAGGGVDAAHRLDLFLVHVLVDQEVAGLEELGGGEAPLVAAADHERVLGRGFESAVDDDEALVLAEADAGDPRGHGRRAVQTVVRQPVVLSAVRDIDLEAGDLDGGHEVARPEVLDRREAAVRQAHERAEEEAVAPAGAGAARTRTSRSGPARAGAAGAAPAAGRPAASGRVTARGPAARRPSAGGATGGPTGRTAG